MTLKGIQLEGVELPLLKVSKVTAINFSKKGRLGRIYFEEMDSGEWRITYTSHTIPDIKKLTAIKLVRESNKL